ncbi:MAG TPA: hypothetical protein VIT67_15705 [Povalibacter sp.]
MKKWGGYLFFFGVGSIVLYFLHLQFILLAWIDMWGITIGWIIRIGLAVVGAAMWLLGKEPESGAANS